MKTCHNCACDPVCNHTWNGWETCGNWIQKPEKPLTNADHIRAMSDEELAEFLERVHVDPCLACCDNLYWCLRNNAPEPVCQKHFLKWLQQLAEEDT